MNTQKQIVPFISVIVPCYNQGEYLSEALESVINQTYSNWECIIIDDGSTDNSYSIAQKWSEIDSRFILLKKENGGLSDARNYGIERAQGVWILPLDADDKICPYYLDYAEKEIKKDESIDIIYCRAGFFGETTGEWSLIDFDFTKMLSENQIFCSAIFKKSEWYRVGGYDINMIFGFEDWDFWINILKLKNPKIVKLNYIGFLYRKKSQSMTTEMIKFKERIRMMHNYIYHKHEDIYYDHFGSFQDLALEYTKVNGSNKYFIKLINHNFITKKLFKIIRLLNRF